MYMYKYICLYTVDAKQVGKWTWADLCPFAHLSCALGLEGHVPAFWLLLYVIPKILVPDS